MATTGFWLVWSPQGGTPPSRRHATEDAAREEAERLSRQAPGDEFYVLASKAVVRTVRPVEWVDCEPDTIPF